MQKLILIICATFLVWISTGRADPVDPSGALCDRTLSFEKVMDPQSNFLNASERAQINKGGRVLKFVGQAGGYEIGYVFTLTPYDPKFVMGVYSSAHEHAGAKGLGKYVEKSVVHSPNVDAPGNPFRVSYRQQVDFPSKCEYLLENRLGRLAEGEGYRMDSALISSADAWFSPRWADSYFSVTARGAGSFVIACNYMVPRSGLAKGEVNKLARERLDQTAENLLRWAERVSADSAAAQAKRGRMDTFFPQ